MPIKFQDTHIYLKGTCESHLDDPNTGDIKYWTNKSQTNNVTTSATLDAIKGGLGNPANCIIGTDSDVKVEEVASDFNLFAKAAQVGAALSYNAVVPRCTSITATGATLTITVADGTPVADYGMTNPVAYVLEVGVANHVADKGTAYEVDPTTGLIKGFAATTGKSYKVWYSVRQANAQVADLSSNFNPGVYRYVADIAGYANQGESVDQSMRCGTLRVIIPYLKLGAKADTSGAQTTADTTNVSGQAIAYDDLVESGECSETNYGHLAYFIWIPFNAEEGISGLAVVGGEVTLPVSKTAQIPVKLVMEDGSLVQPQYSDLTFTATGAPSGTTVNATGLISSGTTAGDFEVNITKGSLTCVVNVSVTAS